MAIQAVGDPDYGPLLLDINITGGIKDARVTERVRCESFWRRSKPQSLPCNSGLQLLIEVNTFETNSVCLLSRHFQFFLRHRELWLICFYPWKELRYLAFVLLHLRP